jgi:hypothetical protein
LISLLADKVSLLGEFQFVQYDLKRYRFKCRVGPSTLYSSWETEVLSDLEEKVRLLADADAQWEGVGPQTRTELFKARRSERSKYPLPEDVLARVKAVYDNYVQARVDLSLALEAATGAEDFCDMSPENPRIDTRTYAFRHGTIWSCRRKLSREDWIALIDRENRRAEDTLNAAVRAPVDGGQTGRSISVEVRREVWRRDNARCTSCGSQGRLEFDHIIPVSMGGASTARNVQLLCEACNRAKGATLG